MLRRRGCVRDLPAAGWTIIPNGGPARSAGQGVGLWSQVENARMPCRRGRATPRSRRPVRRRPTFEMLWRQLLRIWPRAGGPTRQPFVRQHPERAPPRTRRHPERL